MSNSRRRAWGFGLLVCALVGPLVLDPFSTDTLSRILLFGLLAVSLDMLVGIGGMPSLGHAAYFAVGAYTAGFVAINWTTHAIVQMAAAAVAALVIGALTGWVAVRSRGIYFLMLTLALGQILFKIAEGWSSVTGGANGMYGIPAADLGFTGISLSGPSATYYYVLAVAVAGYAGVRGFVRAPVGRALQGVRDSERRMRALGYSPYLLRYGAFCLSALVAGVAGSLLSVQQRLVSPADAEFGTSALALLAVIIGGTGSLWGPFIGAAIVILIRDYFGTALGGHAPLLLGSVFIVVVYTMPGGIAGLRAQLRGSRS